jgi:hypothetical protein
MMSAFMLCVVFHICYAECCYAECHYANVIMLSAAAPILLVSNL